VPLPASAAAAAAAAAEEPENAALLHRLLSALEGGVGTAESTILFGHDGNLDGLALLLGLRWKIPPYASDCI
jgi:hypothetical protein